jgi:hypothetical protein
MPIATKKPSKPRGKPTLGQLARKAERLRAKVEDLEDRRDLDAAMARNAGKPGIPWAKARAELGIGR